MKITLIYLKMKLHAELIFIRKVSNLDSFWKEAQEISEMAYLITALLFIQNIFPFLIG